MVRRAVIRAIRSSRPADRLMMIFAAVAAALFLVSFAGIAMEKESRQGSVDVLYGKIAAVDTSHPTGSLTMHSPITGEPLLNIFVNDDTAVKMCDADKSLKDIRIGSNAQVTYYELAGVAVADFIYVPC
jgi:NAD/NADP transhydrogenase beta subunit